MGNTESVSKEQLAQRNYWLLIDKSGSMSATDTPGGKSRWEWAQEQTENIARECAKFDADGIDVILFAGAPKVYNNVTPDKVTQIFRENSPGGSTDTAAALKVPLDSYFTQKAAGTAKHITIVCVTDGEPTDKAAVARVIKEATQKMDDDIEIGITFIQVGQDQGARAYLEGLDNDIQGAKYDIVDTKNDAEMENMTTEALLVAAITD